jgi:hypothetical protein
MRNLIEPSGSAMIGQLNAHTKSQKPIEFKKIQTLSVKPSGQAVA